MSRNCQKCGGQVGEEDLYCIHCGMPLERTKQEETQSPVQGERTQQAREEKTEMAKPLSVKDYLLIGVLFSIPIVNIILMILWAVGKEGNPNRRNLARACLIFSAIGIVVGVIFMVGLVRAAWLDEQNYPEHYEYYDEYYDDYDDYEYYEDFEDFEDWEDWEDYDYDHDMEQEHHWKDILEDWGEI